MDLSPLRVYRSQSQPCDLDSVGLASDSVAVATMLLWHTSLTKSSICGKQFNKNKSEVGWAKVTHKLTKDTLIAFLPDSAKNRQNRVRITLTIIDYGEYI
jgi:hypothetical protein